MSNNADSIRSTDLSKSQQVLLTQKLDFSETLVSGITPVNQHKKITLNGLSIQDALLSVNNSPENFFGIKSDATVAKEEARKLIDSFNCTEVNRVASKKRFFNAKRVAEEQAKQLLDDFNLVDANKERDQQIKDKAWFDTVDLIFSYDTTLITVGTGQFLDNHAETGKEIKN